MLVILPFEVDFYKKWGLEVEYVGHPLVEVVETARKSGPPAQIGTTGKPLIALLPGSREQEIRTKLPIMLSVVEAFPHYEFAVAMAPSQGESLYREIAGGKPITLVAGQTYDLLQQARAALVTSGTATLETALFGVPQIVCYKGHPASYWLAKKLIKVKYISLVNLILDRPVVPELIQDDLNTKRLIQELQKLLPEDSTDRKEMQAQYAGLWNLLGSRRASKQAAALILRNL
jgi:lipid-A-disaccharide synthase